LLALIGGATAIGFAPIFAKLAIGADVEGGGLSPVAVAFWRMLLAAPAFALLGWRQRRRGGVAAARLPAWRWALPGVFFAVDLGVWHLSFEYTSVANSTLEANLAVVVVALAGRRLFGEQLRPVFYVGALLALAGIARLVGFSMASGGDAWIGDLMGVSVAFAYAAYQLATKDLARRVSVNALMTATSGVAAALLLVGALASSGHVVPQTAAAWGYTVALAVTAQLIGQGLIAYGVARLPAAFAAVVLVLQPMVAAVLAWVWLGQALGVVELVCGAMVVAGIVLARRGSGAR
jgi:drug/metabolite transporter (DMT)-like permease